MNWSNTWPTTQNPNPPATNNGVSLREIKEYSIDKDNVVQPSDIAKGPTWSTQANPWDALSQDELLVKHIALKEAVDKAKEAEMELRKYIVKRAFPEKKEGMNTLELGNGYQLKATVKFNYNLADNDTVEKTLDKIAKIGNEGTFIAQRLVGWTPSFHLTEYRNLLEAAPSSAVAQEILAAIGEMLIINEAAPTLEIKEPKKKK